MARQLAAFGLAASLALASAAGAQAPARASSGDEALKALEACRAISDAAERLACYDAASARLAEAIERKDLVVMDRQEMRKTRRSLFGFSLPDVGLFGGKAGNEEKIDEITATVASVSALPNGRWQIRLDTGALWQTTEVSPYVSQPRKGNKIVIKRGALGNYFMRIEGQRAIRSMRVG